jgi:hypothetical protein
VPRAGYSAPVRPVSENPEKNAFQIGSLLSDAGRNGEVCDFHECRLCCLRLGRSDDIRDSTADRGFADSSLEGMGFELAVRLYVRLLTR